MIPKFPLKSLHVAVFKGKEYHNLIADGKISIYKNHKYIGNGIGAHWYDLKLCGSGNKLSKL